MSIRNKKVTIATAGASLALVAALVGTGVAGPSTAAWAAPSAPIVDGVRQASPTPEAKPKRERQRPARNGQGQGQGQRSNMQQRQQQHDAYLNALAGRLGLNVDQLKAAMQQSHIDLINQAVSEGKITQEQADRRIQAIQSGQHPGAMGPGAGNQRPGRPNAGQRGPGMQSQRGPGGPGGAQMGAGQEVASILGVTPQELRTELQGGKTLAQVGEAKGISRDDLKAKLLAAHKARTDAAVAAGRLTAEQAQKMTERATANVDRMLDATPGQRRGPRGGA
jgi:hypothetical protein